MITAKVTLTEPLGSGRQFVAGTGSGHHLLLDDNEGASGSKPVELVAVALAGCTAFDVIAILRKKRQSITGYEVHVEAEQAPHVPMVFSSVRVHHIVSGSDVDNKAVADAIRISEEKYCSVGAMLRKSVPIITTFEVRQEIPEWAADAELATT